MILRMSYISLSNIIGLVFVFEANEGVEENLEAIQTSEYDGSASSFNVRPFHFRTGILYKQKRERHLVPIDDVRSSYTY
jgi:hypothetical protein